MKTRETIKKRLGILVFILSAVLVATAMNACGKKDGGGGGGGGNPYVPAGCAGCVPGQGTVLATAFGIHSPNTIALGLTFYGQGAPQGGYYTGPVSAQGELFVGPQAGGWYCPLPPGLYQVGTIQAGQWSSQMVANLVLEANGPGGRVRIIMIQNGVYQASPNIQYSGRTYPNYLWGNVLIESVNGQPCQPQYPYFLQ